MEAYQKWENRRHPWNTINSFLFSNYWFSFDNYVSGNQTITTTFVVKEHKRAKSIAMKEKRRRFRSGTNCQRWNTQEQQREWNKKKREGNYGNMINSIYFLLQDTVMITTNANLLLLEKHYDGRDVQSFIVVSITYWEKSVL